MKFSETWLREWADPPVSTQELAEQLTMAGLEVDAVEPAAPAFEGVVVARVLDVQPHPDADKLRVCRVEVGTGEPLTIVCGAANVRAGLRVPAALVGGRLPGDLKIKKARLRGVESSGMLCSARELGLAEAGEGLMELPDEARMGEDLRRYLDLDDRIIALDLTPNRGDCLSVAGVAREVGALNRCAVQGPAISAVPPVIDDAFPVDVSAPEDCPRYLGRVIRGIDPSARTPLWMQERLRRGGVRSLGPVVDVTNYVLLELGQPMHAFDLARLEGGIQVRRARPGERLTLLDGKEIAAEPDTLLIADHVRPVALAGIMGGQGSAVDAGTRDLFLECAFFAPRAIAGRARRHGLQTDSSQRFERGVDPALQAQAVERASTLLLDIVGGQPGPVVECASEPHLPPARTVTLRRARLGRLLGTAIPDGEAQEILTRLGMECRASEGGWEVTPPSFRFDVALEADLVEEVARVYGYDRLPSRTPRGTLAMHARPEGCLEPARLRDALVDRGYQEVVTYSFVDPADERLLNRERTPLALANPLSSEMAVMRTSLWPGLLRTLLHNLHRQQERIRIFELGMSFIPQGTDLEQKNKISGAVMGHVWPEQWGEPGRPADLYDIKGDVEALLDLTGAGDEFIFESARNPALHPGQSARIGRRNTAVGWVGALHPQIQQQLGVSDSILLFELDLAAVSEAAIPRFQSISKFPSIRRDLAVIVNENVSAQQVRACVAGAMPELLREIRLFDVYRGPGIESGRKSLALGLILQDSSRTLTDEEVDTAVGRVVAELEEKLGASLRD